MDSRTLQIYYRKNTFPERIILAVGQNGDLGFSRNILDRDEICQIIKFLAAS